MLGQSETTIITTPAESGSYSLHALILTGVLSAAAGSLGTVVIKRLIPEPTAGDGFTVRWLEQSDGSERRLDFGTSFNDAQQFAIDKRDKVADVQILEIRGGIVKKIIRVPSQQVLDNRAAAVEDAVARAEGQAPLPGTGS